MEEWFDVWYLAFAVLPDQTVRNGLVKQSNPKLASYAKCGTNVAFRLLCVAPISSRLLPAQTLKPPPFAANANIGPNKIPGRQHALSHVSRCWRMALLEALPASAGLQMGNTARRLPWCGNLGRRSLP